MESDERFVDIIYQFFIIYGQIMGVIILSVSLSQYIPRVSGGRGGVGWEGSVTDWPSLQAGEGREIECHRPNLKEHRLLLLSSCHPRYPSLSQISPFSPCINLTSHNLLPTHPAFTSHTITFLSPSLTLFTFSPHHLHTTHPTCPSLTSPYLPHRLSHTLPYLLHSSPFLTHLSTSLPHPVS